MMHSVDPMNYDSSCAVATDVNNALFGLQVQAILGQSNSPTTSLHNRAKNLSQILTRLQAYAPIG